MGEGEGERREKEGRRELRAQRKEGVLSFSLSPRTVTTTSPNFRDYSQLMRTMSSACGLPVECLQFVQAPMVR